MNDFIRFNAYGMIFKIKITGYNDENEWLKTSFSFKFDDIINYRATNKELFTKECIDILIYDLHRHLNNEMKKRKTVSFLEPDFEFVFIPAKKIYGEDDLFDVSMEMHVNLWHKGLTPNYFSLLLERNDIQRFYNYLLAVKNYEKDKEQQI